MKKNLLLASFILLGTLLSPSAFAARKKLPPMNEYVGQIMSRMTLQEKIGQLNLMVAGDITAGKIVQLYIRDKHLPSCEGAEGIPSHPPCCWRESGC